MARKPMMIEEGIEFDPTVQTEADEARAEIAEAQRAARRKGKDKTAPAAATTDRPTAAILPIYLREYVLEGDFDGPKRGREWPLDDLVTFYGKLARYAREHHEAKASVAFKAARDHKRHVDHARD